MKYSRFLEISVGFLSIDKELFTKIVEQLGLMEDVNCCAPEV